MSSVRVRFAPSPTGQFHVGSARTALFNWLYARHCGGTFILRIEDTDRERNTPDALAALLQGMRWLGLDWDEGPEVSGSCGPYFQSQRGSLYAEYVQRLKTSGRAYEQDGAVYFKLEGERYHELDPHLGREVEKVRAAPQIIDDLIRGRVERAEERDFVIVRSSGEPVFHLVNVVDDLTMGITHVIRGEDHLSNTSKHCELFRAFGAEPPHYAHIPLILKSNGKGKMSKRDEGALVEEYMEKQFLPEAVRNYLCLLGWSPKDGRELMPIEDLIRDFDFSGVAASNARFDHEKLVHLNSLALRALPVADFNSRARRVLPQAWIEEHAPDYVERVLALAQQKVNRLHDLPQLIDYFFVNPPPRDPQVWDKLSAKGSPLQRLNEITPALETLSEENWNADSVKERCTQTATAQDIKPSEYFPVLRYAVSGSAGGLDLMPVLSVLGRSQVIARLQSLQQSLSHA
ncbi:MAG: glutamate--tRNA ligase [Candidatus Methylacidiphilales bacterium]